MSSRLCRSTRDTSAAEVRRALKRKMEPSYQGTFTSARRHVFHTFATTHSAADEEARVAIHAEHASARCATASGCGAESLSVKFAGFDIADISRLPLKRLASILRPFAEGTAGGTGKDAGRASGEDDRGAAHRR